MSEEEKINMNKPGLYFNVTREEYAGIDALNHSYLKKLVPVPAAALIPFGEPTGPMIMGTALHALLLEGEEVAFTHFHVLDVTTRTTKIYKETKEKLGGEATILLRHEWETVKEMAEAILLNPSAREIINDRMSTEVCAVWFDNDSGFLCKALIDLVHPSFVADIKTTSSMEQFMRNTIKLGYFSQSAFYLDGYRIAAEREGDDVTQEEFKFVVVETSPPYRCEVFTLDEECLAYGQAQYREFLKIETSCREWGVYPNFSTETGERTLYLPDWIK